MVRVWDRIVRVIHWTVAVGFFVAYFTEDAVLFLHVWEAGRATMGWFSRNRRMSAARSDAD